jgi:hypothetical protein
MNILLHPVYFPNIAHCAAMVHAEEVTFETDDNFQKQTYRNRTYIKNTKWQALHWKSLQSAYRTSPFFEFYEDDLRPLFHLKTNYIMDFNLKCFEVVSECLQLDLKVNTTETYEHIVEDKTDLRHLVTAKNESLFGFDTYTQVFCEKHGFISNLSILDLLFNEGTNALHYLESQTLKQ